MFAQRWDWCLAVLGLSRLLVGWWVGIGAPTTWWCGGACGPRTTPLGSVPEATLALLREGAFRQRLHAVLVLEGAIGSVTRSRGPIVAVAVIVCAGIKFGTFSSLIPLLAEFKDLYSRPLRCSGRWRRRRPGRRRRRRPGHRRRWCLRYGARGTRRVCSDCVRKSTVRAVSARPVLSKEVACVGSHRRAPLWPVATAGSGPRGSLARR